MCELRQRADVGGVGVEHRLVVRLAVLGERLDDVRVGLVAVGLERVEHHAEAAVGHDRALQRRVGLQADDDLVVLVDVAGRVRGDRARNLRDVEHALLPLLDEQRRSACPRSSSSARWRGARNAVVAVVRRVVLLDEVADVDLLLPEAGPESVPGRTPRRESLVGCRGRRAMSVLLSASPAVRPRRFDEPQQPRPCAGRSSVPRWSGSPRPTRGCRRRRSRAPCAGSRSSSSSMPSQAEASQIRRRISAEFSPMPAVNTSAVDAAEHGGQRADLLGRPVDEIVDREPRRRRSCCRAGRACRC